jgi:hypothetical protein
MSEVIWIPGQARNDNASNKHVVQFKPVGCRRRQRGTGRFDSYGGWACPAGQFNHSTFHASLLYRGGPDQENEK